MKHYTINPYNCFTKRNLPKHFVDRCAHSGNCENDVRGFMHRFSLSDVEYSRTFLKNVGIEEAELMTDETLLMYVLWLMATEISEHKWFYFGL